MLNDPIQVGLVSDTKRTGVLANLVDANTQPLSAGVHARLVDLSPGGSQRLGNYVLAGVSRPLKVTISHSNTNENKPFATQRSLIRFDVEHVDAASGRTVTVSAYLVVASPKTPSLPANTDLELARGLCSFALFGELTEDGMVSQEVGNDVLKRVLLGEP